jgi:tetratricopeptide (TPR) repeat protein
MKSPAIADLQRWSEEVARDAASLAFVPLARAYRRQGRRDAALRLCLRGLEHHPSHVEGHALLAILYFESGHRLKAYDEWSMVLTLDPDNFDALRGMGFYYLEQDDHEAALRHLESAAALKPADPAVREALRIIQERKGQEPETKTVEIAAVAAPPSLEPWQQESIGWSPAARPAATAPAQPQVRNGAATAGAGLTTSSDPIRLFDPVLRGGQVLGALLLDAQGLVLAGSLGGELGRNAEALGAILSVAIQEAARTASHLSLGSWSGVLLEADSAVLHLAPVHDDKIVLLAAHRNAPAGWVLHSAQHAATLAARFLEAYV